MKSRSSHVMSLCALTPWGSPFTVEFLIVCWATDKIILTKKRYFFCFAYKKAVLFTRGRFHCRFIENIQFYNKYYYQYTVYFFFKPGSSTQSGSVDTRILLFFKGKAQTSLFTFLVSSTFLTHCKLSVILADYNIWQGRAVGKSEKLMTVSLDPSAPPNGFAYITDYSHFVLFLERLLDCLGLCYRRKCK